MNNTDAVNEIRKSLNEVLTKKGWNFKLRPLELGKESVTWIQAKDVEKKIDPMSCQLIKGGRKLHPNNNDGFDDLESRKYYAIQQLISYAKLCGLE